MFLKLKIKRKKCNREEKQPKAGNIVSRSNVLIWAIIKHELLTLKQKIMRNYINNIEITM